jgi:hypothetical protein
MCSSGRPANIDDPARLRRCPEGGKVKRLGWSAVVAVLLAACDEPPPPAATVVKPAPAAAPARPVLTVIPESWKHRKPGCKGNDCPWVEADLQRLSDPALEAMLERELAGMTSTGDRPLKAETIPALESGFWPMAERQWHIALQSRMLWQSGPWVSVQLDNYTYTGGAHGIAVTRYWNVDRRGNRRLALSDILVSGQEAAFWRLVKTAHGGWLKAMQSTDAEFSAVWPFKPTDNFALTAQGVVLKYPHYELGPYAFGQPEFLIPYSALSGVLRPEFRP